MLFICLLHIIDKHKKGNLDRQGLNKYGAPSDSRADLYQSHSGDLCLWTATARQGSHFKSHQVEYRTRVHYGVKGTHYTGKATEAPCVCVFNNNLANGAEML